MTDAPCFKGCGRTRLKGHVVCGECHDRARCDKCTRADELQTRMKKRQATIASRKGRI